MLGRYFAEGLRLYGLWGTPKDCSSKMEKYIKIGIKYFIFDLRPPSVSLDSLTLLSEEVVPHFIKKQISEMAKKSRPSYAFLQRLQQSTRTRPISASYKGK